MGITMLLVFVVLGTLAFAAVVASTLTSPEMRAARRDLLRAVGDVTPPASAPRHPRT